MKAAVLGVGSWGTTFAAVMADAGADTVVWGRDASVVEQINSSHRNPTYLGEVALPDAMVATADVQEALDGADLVAVALPAQRLRSIVADFASHVPGDAIVASLMKGIEVNSHLRMSEVLGEVWGVPEDRLAVVSGPNLAHEIASQQPTATVVAASTQSVANRLAEACQNSYFRPYTNIDVPGVELCGAYKNVIAVAVGITSGRGFGHNTTATIITRGLAEIARLGSALGASADTFSGLAGMGDLIATCASPLSRNHRLGNYIGEGMSLEDAIARTGGTAEGYQSSLSISELAAQHGVDVPICDAVVAMLHGGHPIDTIMAALLARPRKAEGE